MSFLPPESKSFTSLLGGLYTPTTQSGWESRFASWQKPASDTEEAKIATATRRVVKALDKCEFLRTKDWRIIPQGSYRNNTNVRADSDVDLAICLTDAFFFYGPNWTNVPREEVGLVPLSFTFEEFKSAIYASARVSQPTFTSHAETAIETSSEKAKTPVNAMPMKTIVSTNWPTNVDAKKRSHILRPAIFTFIFATT